MTDETEDLIPFQEEDGSSMGSISSSGDWCFLWPAGWESDIGWFRRNVPEKMRDWTREALGEGEFLLTALTSGQPL